LLNFNLSVEVNRFWLINGPVFALRLQTGSILTTYLLTLYKLLVKLSPIVGSRSGSAGSADIVGWGSPSKGMDGIGWHVMPCDRIDGISCPIYDDRK
jgi:hypothetical protein